MTTVLRGTDDLRRHVGEHLGHSRYIAISQDEVNQFADLSGDHQWIHVDTERAKAGPFGGTIVHGNLTLSKAATLAQEVFRVEGMKHAVNYGYDRIRFPSPLPVGTRIRLGADLVECTDVGGGLQVAFRLTVEPDGGPKPACVADLLVRYAA
jgi:acyl dehydratase